MMVIVEKMYSENDERVVISESEIQKGYFFGTSESYLLDKKIDVDDFLEYKEEEGYSFSATDYFHRNGINYYGLYTDASDCEYNSWCPYVTEEEIEDLAKKYPYYFDLDSSMEIYKSEDELYNFEEYTFFTYRKSNGNLKTVEIEEGYEKLTLVESCIQKEGTYQIDLYKNENNEYVTVYNSYYAGSFNIVEDYDISPEDIYEKYDYEVEE